MLQKNILGIDIGSSNIAFALIKQGKQPYIIDTALVATPENSVLNGEIKNLETLSELINETIKVKKFKSKTKAIALSVNSPQVVTREFKVPTVKNSELKQAINLDLSKNFPGVEQTHAISFKVYSKTKDFMEGIVTMCPYKIVDTYLALGSMLKVPVKYVDISSNSIAKTYKHFMMDQGEKESLLIVDIGCHNSQVNIIKEGKLVLSRNVQSGGSSLDKVVAHELGVSVKDAEMNKFKKYKDYISNGYNVDSFLRKGYYAIEREIGQTINFYKQNYEDSNIKEILLIGGGSFVLGLELYFKEVFNIKTTVVRPTHNNTNYISKFSRLVHAVGCALREE